MMVRDASKSFLGRQYARTMELAYAFARSMAVAPGRGRVLDCGSGSGHEWSATFGAAPQWSYQGLEWSREQVDAGTAKGLRILAADLNSVFPVADASQDVVIAYSVLEHLLMPCHFLTECRRVLRRGGRLVILTPNIATYFTALQVLMGRMPSSGPHPDSNRLLEAGTKVRYGSFERDDVSTETPQHRHLVVFSFKVLERFLDQAGFSIVASRGFGWYPLPGWAQAPFERLDKTHCHQMVFACEKR